MRDFTLIAYRAYLEALKSSIGIFFRFDNFFKQPSQPESFCLIRHDVDRKPKNAQLMAQLEHELDIHTTYYFRTKNHTLKPDIIKAIHEMGHEIGYHYESLSDTNGNLDAAIEDFKKNLEKIRSIVPVTTCAMHGRPLKPYDNRDIWRNSENHTKLISELKMLGEVYLDLDYSDIAYINDTGRNWTSGKSNIRDKVSSRIQTDFQSGDELLSYLKTSPHPKMVFQIHPERWSYNIWDDLYNRCNDGAVNVAKFLLNKFTHRQQS